MPQSWKRTGRPSRISARSISWPSTEHEELKTRYEFLTAQIADLNASLETLQKTISRINAISRKRFAETFEGVNKCFQEVFTRLFPGGRAELRLTDENDLLETGVDIDIRIPGKRTQSVTLLSGGEKSLSAIALIFSILLYRPVPFLLLDEVDAALDDTNISLFNRLVKETVCPLPDPDDHPQQEDDGDRRQPLRRHDARSRGSPRWSPSTSTEFSFLSLHLLSKSIIKISAPAPPCLNGTAAAQSIFWNGFMEQETTKRDSSTG